MSGPARAQKAPASASSAKKKPAARPEKKSKSKAAIVTQPVPKMMLTVDEAGAALGLKRWKINTLIRSGDLHSLKVGKLRRIPVWALETFVHQQPYGERA
ncbi:MAG TPA: helix-turn-helix domain-containing protein [Ktedonobacterales bacterium]|nr:helix-turn-helix domain-containing protein [Ktedonobacterales bacterium]